MHDELHSFYSSSIYGFIWTYPSEIFPTAAGAFFLQKLSSRDSVTGIGPGESFPAAAGMFFPNETHPQDFIECARFGEVFPDCRRLFSVRREPTNCFGCVCDGKGPPAERARNYNWPSLWLQPAPGSIN